jgi:pSer/pThr/pTyr-binding forkhead associated (FHA) protein
MPTALAQSLISTPTQAVFERYGSTLLLLIELPEEPERMLGPLLERVGNVTEAPAGDAAQGTLEMTLLNADAGKQELFGPDAVELLAKLSSVTHFAFPLWRQHESAQGLSVGRTNENDLVLAEPSVSARHARFEWDPQGTMAVRDLGSKNGTLHNGERLLANQLGWVQPMDQLKFGSIASFVCTAVVLRGALKTLAATRTKS